jgi:hypothetical protein
MQVLASGVLRHMSLQLHIIATLNVPVCHLAGHIPKQHASHPGACACRRTHTNVPFLCCLRDYSGRSPYGRHSACPSHARSAGQIAGGSAAAVAG